MIMQKKINSLTREVNKLKKCINKLEDEIIYLETLVKMKDRELHKYRDFKSIVEKSNYLN